MRRRTRPDSSVPGAAERVQVLLAAGLPGWVPPPDPVAPGPPPDPAAPDPVAPGPPPDVTADDVREDVPAPAAQDPAPARPDRRADAPALRLPAALAHARLDPGLRGAVALVVAALLAAGVAAGVVRSGRPQEVAVPGRAGGVAAPEVVVSGRPLPGASDQPGGAAPGAGPAGAAPAAPVPAGGAGAEVVVAVAGLVQRPGLVRLPQGSRVDDAVRAAGGLRPGVDAGLLNLARKLVDGEQVLVGVEPPPGAPPPGAPPPGAPPPGAGTGPLDLNSATAADLDALPGIGPVLAQRIVDWRTEHGRFASVEQLREVTGIGEAKYADLEDRVTV